MGGELHPARAPLDDAPSAMKPHAMAAERRFHERAASRRRRLSMTQTPNRVTGLRRRASHPDEFSSPA
jgi:hypothetical protein